MTLKEMKRASHVARTVVGIKDDLTKVAGPLRDYRTYLADDCDFPRLHPIAKLAARQVCPSLRALRAEIAALIDLLES